jgi:mono/diheme cytochrome c family protein
VKRKLLPGALALVVFATAGCSWLTDFRQQPSIAPWQSLDGVGADTSTPSRGNPQGSVSTSGTAVAAYQVSYRRSPLTIDSMSTLRNPEAVTQESVDRGWKTFQVNCAVCHGNGGAGDGVVLKFGVGAPSLLVPPYATRTDGYYFGQMRNGGAIMPPMNRIDERDRWNVINYVRGLQGKLPPEIVVRKEAAGLPGVTGAALAGPTGNAPTHLAPFVKPTYVPTPAAAGAVSTNNEKKQ